MRVAFPIAAALLAVSACASTAYGPAERPGAPGYAEQAIENDRFIVRYTADDEAEARQFALLRAAELATERSADWFEVVGRDTDGGGRDSGPRTSVGIGGSAGSGGRSGVGVGIGIGLPVGGGTPVTHVLEILLGTGPRPDRSSVYEASDVISRVAPS